MAVVGVPRRAGRTTRTHGDAARTVAARPRPGYGPPPGPPPARSGPAAGDGPRRPSGSGGGGRRWPRRLVWTLVALLGLGLLAPVVAFLVGWVMFDVPSANQTDVTQVATFKYADGAALATIRPDNVNRTIVTLDQVPEHVRQAVLSAEDRSFYSNPGFDLDRHRPGAVEPAHRRRRRRLDDHPAVREGLHRPGLRRRCGASTRRSSLAVKISKEQTKDQILENYLNVIYFGRGAYGIQAAARPTSARTSRTSRSPRARCSPARSSRRRAGTRRRTPRSRTSAGTSSLDGMVAQGWLPAADRAQQKFPDVPAGARRRAAGIPGDAGGHVYKLAMDELAARRDHRPGDQHRGPDDRPDDRLEAPGAGRRRRRRRCSRASPRTCAARWCRSTPRPARSWPTTAASNGVGVDYAQARRQPGSSFKPFVLSAALQDSRQQVGLGQHLRRVVAAELPRRRR